MTPGGQPLLSTQEAADYTGLSRSTVQRRVDRWFNGDRSAQAIQGSRTHGTAGARRVNPVDAERVRLQLLGELDPALTADEYAKMVAAGNGT